ncbi:MAG: hypothetical protein K6F99_06515 [Lachnospiraceae bacterium]|nr:hypothetical protein [Lachnospiraceae bacterium]
MADTDLIQSMPLLLSKVDPKVALKNFSKAKYEDFFNEYRMSVSDVYTHIREMYKIENEEEKNALMKKAGEALTEYGYNSYKKKNFFVKDTYLADLQFVLAIYVFPGIMAIGNDNDKPFVNIINECWKVKFPKSELKPGTFEQIKKGFKTRILGFEVDGLFGSKSEEDD